MISLPVRVEPVKATLSTPGCLTRYAPVVGAVRRDDVDRAGREADLGRELGDPQHAERRLRIRLEHDRAAGRERRRELPDGHEQRVVPRHDLRADADRLLQRVAEQRAADRVRAAGDRADDGGEEAEVLDGARDLGLDRGDGLADVARLELRELLAVRHDRVGERVQQPGALVRRRLAPRPVERDARGLDGAVDVRFPGHRGAGQRLAGRRLVQVANLARGRLHDLAADEEPVLLSRGHGHRAELSGFAAPTDAVDFGSESPTRGDEMSSTVRVQAARIPDRNRLLEALRDEGLDARAEDEVGIVVPIGEGGSGLYPPGGGRRLQRRRAVRADPARGRDLHPPARRLAASTGAGRGPRLMTSFTTVGAPFCPSLA